MRWVVLNFTLAGLFLGLSAFTFQYGEGFSYLSNDPEACINCHVMRDNYDSWQKANHHAVATCNDCHVPTSTVPKLITKITNGYNHSKGFTFMDFHEPIRITSANSKVLQDNCVRCHETTVKYITAASQNEKNSVNCVSCHSTVGHGGRK